jgi:colanic acid biosynthesis glycosyl transferase WcaI
MRIVFVNRFYAPDHSATSQQLTDLAVELVKRGMEVRVVTSRLRYDGPGGPLPPRETLDGVSVYRVRTSAFGRSTLVGRAIDYASFYVAAAARLLAMLRRGDVVVALTDPPLISIPVGWVGRVRGARRANWLHDIFPEVAAELGMAVGRGVSGRVLTWLRNGSLRMAVVNVVLGRLMCQRVAAMGVDPRMIAVITNWADGAAIQPVPQGENPLRAEWGLDGRFVVGYSGNMGRAHEFHTIVDAAAALQGERDTVFLFVGGGAQKALISAEAAKRGLANLLFKPYQPRDCLAQSLSAADVHLISLRPELEGLVVPSKFYGIAAAARPAIFIGDPEGEIGAEIHAADCGWCVRQGDVAGLVAAIRALRESRELLERMGHNARRIFDERYDKPVAVESWRALLREVGESREG